MMGPEDSHRRLPGDRHKAMMGSVVETNRHKWEIKGSPETKQAGGLGKNRGLKEDQSNHSCQRLLHSHLFMSVINDRERSSSVKNISKMIIKK